MMYNKPFYTYLKLNYYYITSIYPTIINFILLNLLIQILFNQLFHFFFYDVKKMLSNTIQHQFNINLYHMMVLHYFIIFLVLYNFHVHFLNINQ